MRGSDNEKKKVEGHHTILLCSFARFELGQNLGPLLKLGCSFPFDL